MAYTKPEIKRQMLSGLSLLENEILSIMSIYYPLSIDDMGHLYIRTNKSFDAVRFLCEYIASNNLLGIDEIPQSLFGDLRQCRIPNLK